jgi:lysophospholipase L1-like esterase
MKTYLIILLAFVQFGTACATGKRFVKPNDDKIIISGAWFLDKSDERVVINRFDKKTLNNKATYMNKLNANTQTGVTISVYTNSEQVTFEFEKRSDAKIRGCSLGVFKDGKLFKEFKLLKDKWDPVVVTNPDGNKWAKWEVVMPPFYGLNFTGIEIDNGSDYKKPPENKKKVYVAIGNSITHGTGQRGAYQSYPFLLAQGKGWQLYNLATGGSKISWPVAKMIKDKKIDVITVLWGYNDWNAGFMDDGRLQANYKKLLELLVKHHPDTKIYCILPTATKREKPRKGNSTIGQVRQAEKAVVEDLQKNGNKNLYLIKGYEISGVNDLKDLVHFSTEGAAGFADRLEKMIE